MSAPGKLLKALILGAPASGKGTVSARIVKKYKFQHISSGDKLRWHIENKTPLGLEVKHFLDEGKLVPDEVIIKFMMTEIEKVRGKWLLDGFPRTASQAEQLWQVQPVDFAINLKVPFQVIIERAKSRWVHLASGRVYNTNFNAPKVAGRDDVTGEELTQRSDDIPEAVQKRLNIYKEMTDPVINFYKSKKILHEFKGYTTDEIWPEIVKFLDAKVGQCK